MPVENLFPVWGQVIAKTPITAPQLRGEIRAQTYVGRNRQFAVERAVTRRQLSLPPLQTARKLMRAVPYAPKNGDRAKARDRNQYADLAPNHSLP
jgi:hypothetical protein